MDGDPLEALNTLRAVRAAQRRRKKERRRAAKVAAAHDPPSNVQGAADLAVGSGETHGVMSAQAPAPAVAEDPLPKRLRLESAPHYGDQRSMSRASSVIQHSVADTERSMSLAPSSGPTLGEASKTSRRGNDIQRRGAGRGRT